MGDRISNDKEKGESPHLRYAASFKLLLDSLLKKNRLVAIYTLVFIALSLILFPPTQRMKEIKYKEGDIADSDVIAPFTFLVPLDEQEIELNRAKAAVNISPIYRRNLTAEKQLPKDLKDFLHRVAAIARIDTLTADEKAARIKEISPGLQDEDVKLLLDDRTRKKILVEGTHLISSLLKKGIVNDGTPLRRRDYPTIVTIAEDKEKLFPTANIIEQDQLEGIILDKARKLFGSNEGAIRLFYSIVRSYLVPNLIFDSNETKRRRDEAVKNVQTVFKVSKNQRIVAKHDKVSRSQVEILQALEKKKLEMELATSRGKKFWLFFGKGLRIFLLISLLGLAIVKFEPKILGSTKQLTLLFIVELFYLVIFAVVFNIGRFSPYLIPVAFVSLVSTAFFGVQTAIFVTIFSSFMVITHTNLPSHVTFVSMLAGSAAIISIKQLRERKNFYKIFLYVSIAYIIGIFSFKIGAGLSFGTFLVNSLWGIINAFVCTILVMFLLPIFESLFDVTTDFTLMELSDLNRPLLKRLILEAPGTYHHSIMVGNMVEAVAEDVGANSLLARVGAYYHDIGKLSKPEYFFENKGDNANKHEKLSPSMSALILVSHVKEGVELAKKEKLPEVVIDAIREHHGTTVMAYFYQKALEYDSHDSVNIDDFRYPGPRPHSKETALIMLADSTEAAVRSLKEPTAPRIRAVVTKIIESRMNDGELDESGLTLNDIAVIREKFIKILTGIFHPRIPYPSQEEEGGVKEQRGQVGKGQDLKNANGLKPQQKKADIERNRSLND